MRTPIFAALMLSAVLACGCARTAAEGEPVVSVHKSDRAPAAGATDAA